MTATNRAPSSPREWNIDSLEDLLMKMAWFEYRRFWRELSDYNLTPAQFHTLLAIRANGEHTTMGQLADETGQVSATMTGIIDRLVERGWVDRYRSPTDRRTVLVGLTEIGRAKLNDVYQARRSILADCLGKLDVTARGNLATLLKEYLQMIDLLS